MVPKIADSEQAYTALWNHVETSVSDQLVGQGKLPLSKQCKGRGQNLEVQLRKSPFRSGPTKMGRQGDVQPLFVGTSQKHAHWFRQLRRLQSYCRYRRVNSSDCGNAHGASLWGSILRAKGFQGGFCIWWQAEAAKIFSAPDDFPLIPPPAEIAEVIYESFLLDVRKLEQTLRAQQKKHAVDRRKELAHLVFQDIKRTCPDRVDVLLQVNTGTVDADNACLLVQMLRPL